MKNTFVCPQDHFYIWLVGVLLFLGCLIAPAAVWAGQPQNVSLKETLQILLKRSPALARERLTIRQSEADLRVAQGAFGFDLDLNLKLNRSNLPLDSQVDSSVLGEINSNLALQDLRIEGSALLTKRFSTGTLLSLTFFQSWASQDTPSLSDLLLKKKNISTSKTQRVSAVFSAQLVQPLLKGAWFSVNLAPVWQAMEQVKVLRLKVAMVLNTQVAQTARAYWDLVYAKHNYSIKKDALKLAETQLQNTLGMIKAGKLAPLERYQVLQVVAARKGELLVAQNSMNSAETQLKILLKLPSQSTLHPTDLPETKGILSSLRDLELRTLIEHPQIKVAKKQINISKWSVVTAKNSILPELNVTGNFSFVGSGRLQSNTSKPKSNAVVSPLGRAYETLFDPIYQRFYIGIQLKIPLDNRKAEGRLLRNQLEVQRGLLELVRLQHKVRAEVRQQYAQVRVTKQRIAIAKMSNVWAKKKLEAEQVKFKLGQSTLFKVLTFQQDLANAKLSALRAILDYRKAVVSLYEKAGILSQKYGISR